MNRHCENILTCENRKKQTAYHCLPVINNKENVRLQEEHFSLSPIQLQTDDDSESIEIVNTPTCHDLEVFNSMRNVNQSTASDICVLHTLDSYDINKRSQRLKDDVVDADFTVLNAPQRQHSCAFDESTEVLLLMYSDTRSRPSCSGTDSDVEILLTEDVLDSELEQLTPSPDEDVKNSENTSAAVKCKRQEDSATDISSVEEFSYSSVPNYEELTRSQLLNVIREQAVRIGRLEATLQRYCSAQETLFVHVEELRAEFDALKCLPGNCIGDKS